MKALVLKAYKQFSFEDVPNPEPGPDEVLVAVKACGICGSDVHGMDGSTGRRRPPIIMGHEAAGVIAKVGSRTTECATGRTASKSGESGAGTASSRAPAGRAASHGDKAVPAPTLNRPWAAGDRVTFDSTIYCGQCAFCRRGMINLCDRRRVLGVSCEDYRQHGAFAELVAVPQHILYRLPDGLAFEHAALVEPFAIALHAIRRAPPGLNDAVVVVGAGMIGLALVQALRQTGCGKLVVVDIAEDKLALAAKCGATDLINPSTENAVDAILRLTQGSGADLSFEAVGVNATVDLALGCLRKGGAATLIGNVTPKTEFRLQSVVTRELTIYGSCASRGEYPACVEMMARGALQAAPLISATAPLAEGAEWFDRLYRKEPGLLKVVLRP